MDVDKLDINQLLASWSVWAGHDKGYGIGYPSFTINHLMILYGGSAPRGSGKVVMEVNELLETVDSIIAAMPAPMKRVTKVHYLGSGTDVDKQLRVRMNNDQYTNYLERIWSKLRLELKSHDR